MILSMAEAVAEDMAAVVVAEVVVVPDVAMVVMDMADVVTEQAEDMAEVVLAEEAADEATKITNALPRKSKLTIKVLRNQTMLKARIPPTQREEMQVCILYNVIYTVTTDVKYGPHAIGLLYSAILIGETQQIAI